jgi:CRISPR-associated protein Cmr4
MYETSKPLFLLTETPLHAGSGDDLGVVDLPIQRERHTQFPKVEASSLKGAIRQSFERCYPNSSETAAAGNYFNQQIDALFGPEDAGNDGHAGALAFTDARLLLFPVKSMKGVFAWITCPRVLEKLKHDLELTGTSGLSSLPAAGTVPENCQLLINGDNIVLEEFAFKAKTDRSCSVMAAWFSEHLLDNRFDYWKTKMKTDLVVLTDDDFTDFVQLSTEVITRIKIDNNTGTVADGALFSEEYLPAESILYSLVFAARQFMDDAKVRQQKEDDKKSGTPKSRYRERVFETSGDSMNAFVDTLDNKIHNIFQLGGNATLGKGIIRAKIL